jgi:hypothetical protein
MLGFYYITAETGGGVRAAYDGGEALCMAEKAKGVWIAKGRERCAKNAKGVL